MTKTTIYLDEKYLKSLKILAAKSPTKTNVADLIRSAVFEFLNRQKYSPQGFSKLLNLLKQTPQPASFGDAVDYQRSLRDEWQD